MVNFILFVKKTYITTHYLVRFVFMIFQRESSWIGYIGQEAFIPRVSIDVHGIKQRAKINDSELEELSLLILKELSPYRHL